jgi:hypothetical protein
MSLPYTMAGSGRESLCSHAAGGGDSEKNSLLLSIYQICFVSIVCAERPTEKDLYYVPRSIRKVVELFIDFVTLCVSLPRHKPPPREQSTHILRTL